MCCTKEVRMILKVLLISCLLAGTLVFTSCVSANKGNEKADDSNGYTAGKITAIDMMNKAPRSTTSFAYLDVYKMRSDNDLHTIYEEYEASFQGWKESFHVDFANVDAFAMMGDQTVLFEGNLYLEDIKELLQEVYHAELLDHKGIEVWNDNGGWVAFWEGGIIIGPEETLRDCIDVLQGENDSLYDDVDFREVIDRLPDGVTMEWWEGPAYGLDGLDHWGYSISKKDPYTLEQAYVFIFEDEEAAAEGMYSVEGIWSNLTHLSQDGDVVQTIIEIEIGEFAPPF